MSFEILASHLGLGNITNLNFDKNALNIYIHNRVYEDSKLTWNSKKNEKKDNIFSKKNNKNYKYNYNYTKYKTKYY